MRDPAPWQKRYDRLLILSVCLGTAAQYLFVDKAPGLSVILFVSGLYGVFFYAAKGRMGGFGRWKGQLESGWLLTIPVIMLALTYALYDNIFFKLMNFLMLALLLGAQTLLLTRGGSQPWHRLVFYKEMLKQSLIVPLTHIPVPFGIIRGWFAKDKGDDGERASGNRRLIRRIGTGLLLVFPLLLLVVALLSAADGIFQAWVNKLPELLFIESTGSLVPRIIVGGFIAFYVFCYIWGLLFRKESPWQQTESGSRAIQPAKVGIDSVTAGTALVSINLVYLLFVGIQFSYLFGAAEGLLPEGIVYADYARRGFAELLMVCLINQGLLIFGLHFIRGAGAMGELVRKLLLSLLTGCTAVMLISAYSRLHLYEEAYGYTQARLLAHGFMLFLAVLMAVALIRVWNDRFSLAKVYIAAAIGAYLVMNYANLDERIAVNNMERYERTGKIDMSYLATLSADAAPALRELQERYPELVEAGPIIEDLKREAEASLGWASWNLARYKVLN